MWRKADDIYVCLQQDKAERDADDAEGWWLLT